MIDRVCKQNRFKQASTSKLKMLRERKIERWVREDVQRRERENFREWCAAF